LRRRKQIRISAPPEDRRALLDEGARRLQMILGSAGLDLVQGLKVQEFG
jgi:hypothetical protein